MDVSGLMNIHDLAMIKTIRQTADIQARQEKLNQWIETQDANQTTVMGNKTPLEAYPGALTISPVQQQDPQAEKIRVERQVDVQASRETVQGSEENRVSEEGSKAPGSIIDIIT